MVPYNLKGTHYPLYSAHNVDVVSQIKCISYYNKEVLLVTNKMDGQYIIVRLRITLSYLVNIIQQKITTYRYAQEPFGNRGMFKSLGTTLTNQSCIHGSIEIRLKRGLHIFASSVMFCLSVRFIKLVVKLDSL